MSILLKMRNRGAPTRNFLESYKVRTLFLGCALLLAAPNGASAAELFFDYEGVVSSETQLSGTPNVSAALAPVKVGDAITARFTIDPTAVTLGGCNPIGGGLSCTYNVTLQNYSLSVGNYTTSFTQLPSAFYIQNDMFGQDALGFAYTDVAAGPFDSTLTGIQFQGRYSGNTLTSSDFSSSLPFEAADWSLFAFFSGPAGRVDFRGPLTLQVSSAAAVPEPAMWIMMILGMGAIGASMRQKLKPLTTSVFG